MRGRERLFATVAIWAAFAFVMNTLLDRLTIVNANFNGLWPTISDPNIWTNSNFQQIWDAVNQNALNMMAQVNQSINSQLAGNLPILVILSLAMIVAAMASTSFVWHNAHLEPAEASQTQHNANRGSKSKRGGRVERVMDALDEDELAELRARLIDPEEVEAASFEELLAGRERR